MKILLSLILMVSVMNFVEFQKLIGKNISEAYHVIDNSFEKDVSNNDLYFMETESYKYFYGMPSYYIVISNDNDVIDSITFYFHGIIDESFYDAFINDYGNPRTIQVVEKVEVLDKGMSTKDAVVPQYLEKRFLTTREGSFEEKPLYMIWDKDGYQIKILLKHPQNKSEITFRLPSDKF